MSHPRWMEVLSRPVFSRPVAWFADRQFPRFLLDRVLRSYVKAYRVDMSEAARPLDSFPTFNAFFTRRLRDGARPVAAQPDVMVAPSDSRLHVIGTIPESGELEQIKGITYTLESLLADPAEAEVFRNGVHATLYLSPSMYHRVHSPVDGRIRSWRYVPGRLFPVNERAVRSVRGLFTVNERVCVRIDTDRFGPLALIMVGATNVGRMSLSFADLVTNTGTPARRVEPPSPIPVARGAEVGVFNLGSTVVLLAAERSLVPADVTAGQLLRMGQPLWRRPATGTPGA